MFLSLLNLILHVQVHPRIGVAIGEHILDLEAVAHLFNGPELKNNQHVFKEVTKSIIEIVRHSLIGLFPNDYH